jgi:hypothetical protein
METGNVMLSIGYKDDRWCWRYMDTTGYQHDYMTGKNGEGVYIWDWELNDWKQIATAAEFKACRSRSGMRRKILKFIGD